MDRNKFDEIFLDDPLGLLNVTSTESSTERTPSEKRLIESFEEINAFYEREKREPSFSGEIDEYMLASRLQGIRLDPKKVHTLLQFDFYDLLKCGESKSVTVEDILGDDPLDLLGCGDGEDSIFTLKYVKKSDRLRPDFISRRNVCKDFSDYEGLFQIIHDELKAGKRHLTEFHEPDLKVGRFYVLRGVLLFLEKSDDEEIEFQYESGTRIRNDGRTRCIFDNGTESDMLFRSLAKALIKDGFGVSDVVSDDQAVQQGVDENDIQNGYIYVLSSLSPDPRIQKMENLYKVGYCSGDITDRIKNAKNEPTYLMSDVKIELAVRCYNMNVPNLESAIHAFFSKVNVAFEVYDSNGEKHYPREWFVAPLSIIQEVIQLIVDEKSDSYRYDPETMQLILMG